MLSHPLKNRSAVVLAVICFWALCSTTLLAEDSSDLLDKAAKQIDAKDYLAAEETLAKVKTAQLTPADRDRLTHLRVKADHALKKAGEVRQSISEAEQLAKQNDFVRARQVLEAARKSVSRDQAAQKRINAKLVVIEERRKLFAKKMSELFSKSVGDYKAGRINRA